jgi:hypothetical protein
VKRTINSRLFFFNTDTDYLPYYKNYSETIDDSKSLKDLLKALSGQIQNYTITANVSINGIIVNDSLSIEDVVNTFGTELEIEPVSIYRATKDLEIDNSDFMDKFKLLEYYSMDGDKEFYESLANTYYASSSLKHNQNYYGEPLFLLAHRIIIRNATHKVAILKIINDAANGLSNYEFDNKTLPLVEVSSIVTELKEMIAAQDTLSNKVDAIKAKIKAKICKPKTEVASELKDVANTDFKTLELLNSFKGFNIAFYKGPQPTQTHDELLAFTEANEVSFAAQHKASGLNIVKEASELAFSKGSEIIVDAFDSSADILVVENEDQRAYLSSKKNRRASKRDIDLQIVTSSQLLEIALGNKDKKALGLDKAGIRFI